MHLRPHAAHGFDSRRDALADRRLGVGLRHLPTGLSPNSGCDRRCIVGVGAARSRRRSPGPLGTFAHAQRHIQAPLSPDGDGVAGRCGATPQRRGCAWKCARSIGGEDVDREHGRGSASDGARSRGVGARKDRLPCRPRRATPPARRRKASDGSRRDRLRITCLRGEARMMKSTLLALAVLFSTALPAARAGDLLARMASLNPNLHAFTATLHAHAVMKSFPFLSADLVGTYYYKEPDKTKVVFSSGVPVVARQFDRLYAHIESPSRWRDVYVVDVVSDDGRTATFRLTPRKRGNVDRIDATVDDKTATLTTMRWEYENGGYA